ncbi:hypothetical protein BJX96DRAFT_118468 [Aspergillus floccosus]
MGTTKKEEICPEARLPSSPDRTWLIPSQPLSGEERRALSDRLPHQSCLLREQSEHRKYFDSGDLALSAAHCETELGPIHTGENHPTRENISHPYAPVPSSSNVNKNANKCFHGKSSCLEPSCRNGR